MKSSYCKKQQAQLTLTEYLLFKDDRSKDI